MEPDLSPILRRQNAIHNDFGAKQAANTFSRNLSAMHGQRKIADFRQGFQRSMPRFTAGFAQRGMGGPGIQSGVMRRAMMQRVGDYTRDLGRMQEDVFNQDREFEFNGARFTAERDQALADLQAQKAAMIAQTAQQIAALKPYMGGF